MTGQRLNHMKYYLYVKTLLYDYSTSSFRRKIALLFTQKLRRIFEKFAETNNNTQIVMKQQ